MTAPAPAPPDERPYDPVADAQAGYMLWVELMRRQHVARAVLRDTERAAVPGVATDGGEAGDGN